MVPDSEEIIKLLSMLKAETPDYPVELFTARKTAFLKHAAAIKIQIKGQGGDGGQAGGSGGSGSALGGSTTAPGAAFQALIGFGLVAAMLIGAFMFSNPNDDSTDRTTIVATQENSGSVILPLTGSAPPTPTLVLTEIVPTPDITTGNQVVSDEIEKTIFDEITELKKEKKPNPGLHLGQADGTPAAPGQGNPGNINPPDKPDKPEKSKNPKKPVKP